MRIYRHYSAILGALQVHKQPSKNNNTMLAHELLGYEIHLMCVGKLMLTHAMISKLVLIPITTLDNRNTGYKEDRIKKAKD